MDPLTDCIWAWSDSWAGSSFHLRPFLLLNDSWKLTETARHHRSQGEVVVNGAANSVEFLLDRRWTHLTFPHLTGSHPVGAGKALLKPFNSSLLLFPICTVLIRCSGTNVPINKAPWILECGSGGLGLGVVPSVVLATHTHRHAAFPSFACLIGVSTLYLEWSKMAMKFCTKLLRNSFSAYFFPLSPAEILAGFHC